MSSPPDRAAIEELLNAYAFAVDGKDWDALAALFTPDAVLDYTASRGPRGTPAEVIPWLREALDGFEATQHLITNRAVEIDGAAASSVAYYFNPMKASGSVLFVGGTYRTTYERHPAGWLIAEHVQTVSWMHRP